MRILRQRNRGIILISYYILIFTFITDTVRSVVKIPTALFYLTGIYKEIIILFLFLFTVLNIKRYLHKSLLPYLIFGLYTSIITFYFLFNNVITPVVNIRSLYTYIRFPMLIYILFYFYENTGEKYMKLYKFFLKGVVVLFFISFISYVFKISFFEFPYYNRISIGNPSVTSITYLLCFYSIIYLKEDLNFSMIKYNFYLVSFFLAILLTVTSTAMVVIIFISVFTLILPYRKNLLYENKKLGLLGLGLVIMILIFFEKETTSLFSYFLFRFENLKNLILIKMGNTDVKLETVSFSIREQQWEKILYDIKLNKENYILGLGGGSYFRFTKLMENQYSAMIGNYGIIGLFLYLILWLKNIIYSLINVNKHKILLIIITMIALIYSISLELLTVYSFVGSYALLYAMILKNENLK